MQSVGSEGTGAVSVKYSLYGQRVQGAVSVKYSLYGQRVPGAVSVKMHPVRPEGTGV